MSQDRIAIASVTGIDVELQIAGPGSRSYAFVIDWHIRLIFAIAWFAGSLLVLSGTWSFAWPDDAQGSFTWIVVVPTALIYLFYQPVCEILMRGRTPGKRMAGVRIATLDGDVPGVGALLIRNLFRLIDSMPVFYIVGLVTTLVTAQHVRIGDLAAGTVLVFDYDRDGKSLARLNALSKTLGSTAIDPKLAGLIDELLERWQELSADKRRPLAITVLVKIDPQTNRSALDDLGDQALKERLQAALGAERAT